MANLKETRNRITSIKSTMQITSAMKMVSAAKLKRAQDSITQMRPYADKLKEILVNLTSGSDDSDGGNKYSIIRPVSKVLIVAISSNRGLCGGFNANITKRCKLLVEKTYADKELSFFCVGKKVNEWLGLRGFNVVKSETDVYGDLNFGTVTPIAENVIDEFLSGNYDKVVLIYNQFKNAATQLVQEEQFLPLDSTREDQQLSHPTDYIYEPNKEVIISELIPKSLKTQFYKAILDSVAGEHGARMTAMHKATDNANELANDLTLKYNKARQAAITTEILEIVGGAEALKS